MKIVVSNSAIAPHVKQTVLAYETAGFLTKFYTSFYKHPRNKLSVILQKIGPFKERINRRSFTELPINKFESKPLRELIRTFSSHFLNEKLTDNIWEWAEVNFDKWVSKKIKNTKIDAIHTYEYIALETIIAAKKRGIFTIYEQPSVHYATAKAIADEQLNKFPELWNNNVAKKSNKTEYRNKRRARELFETDLILCNSSFTTKTLIDGGIPPKKIITIPLPFPKPIETKIKKPSKPFIFLFAGNQSVIKGAHILYASWLKCKFNRDEAELWLIGKMLLPESLRKNLPGKIVIKDTIPREELMVLYQYADILIMPTLSDGFGMVITEAMSQGLPVIATTNSCANDFIENGINGWVIPANDEKALTEQMILCLKGKDKLHNIGLRAIESAKKWQELDYSKLLSKTIENKWKQFKKDTY